MRAASCACQLLPAGPGVADVDATWCLVHRELPAARVPRRAVDGALLVALSEYCPA